MKNNKTKIKSKKGFTLTEMLATVLIMSLVMTVVANGVAHIKDIYEKTVEKSDAQMLLSMTEEQLRDELEFAVVTKSESESGRLYYVTSDSYMWKTIAPNAEDNNNLYLYYYDNMGDAVGDPLYSEPLIRIDTNTRGAGKDTRLQNLKVTFGRITYNDKKFTVSNLAVKDASDTLLAGGEGEDAVNVVIRPVNDVEEK